MADPNTKVDESVGGPESATAQSSNAGERGTSSGKGLAGDTGGKWCRGLGDTTVQLQVPHIKL